MHMEGQLNERIVAGSLYYYDSQNITPNRITFQQKFENVLADNGWGSKGKGWNGVEDFFGVADTDPHVQILGSVHGREGRLLAFPNVLRHRINQFQLIDKTKSGHCKVAAFFLVDPSRPILSTANVAPQRKDWWVDRLIQTQALRGLPQELQDHVLDEVEEFPMDSEEGEKQMLKVLNAYRDAQVDLAARLPRGFRFS
jgi:hypothetical protein